MRTGASGYVVKSDARGELLPAVEAVLQGKRFVSASLAANDLTDPKEEHIVDPACRRQVVAPLAPQNAEIARHHEAGVYSNDRCFLDGLTQFIGAALNAGNGVIVLATESHGNGLLPRLQAHGLDIDAAAKEGRSILLDAADTLSTFMVKDQPDRVRFLKVVGDLIVAAAKAVKGERPRVAACGECASLLWARGNAEAAIQVEKCTNQLAMTYDVDILCAYCVGSVQGGMDSQMLEKIYAEHSDVHL